MYKYILFDFDGTLLDTNDLIISGLNKAAKKFIGRELSSEDLNAILGKFLEEQMRHLSEEHYNDMVLLYREFYKQNQDKMSKEFPGINQMLHDLKGLGCKIAVVSAKGRGGIEHGMKQFGMQEYIDLVISAYDVENNKPHPEPALKALEGFGAEAGSALMIGDSPYDILCGKNAGIKTVLVDWTIFPKQQILDLKPDYHIKTPQDLVDIIKSSKST